MSVFSQRERKYPLDRTERLFVPTGDIEIDLTLIEQAAQRLEQTILDPTNSTLDGLDALDQFLSRASGSLAPTHPAHRISYILHELRRSVKALQDKEESKNDEGSR